MLHNPSLVGAVLLSAVAFLPGCQSGEVLGALNLGGRGASADGQAQTRVAGAEPVGEVRESELRAYCPPVTLRADTAFFRAYQKGGRDDPSKILYQASITDVTRACAYGSGAFTLNVAVAGRVVPGPVGTTGSVTLPIRLAVLRGDEVVYSKLFEQQVAIGDTSGATQFIFNDPGIVVAGNADRSVQAIVGFDEGVPGSR